MSPIVDPLDEEDPFSSVTADRALAEDEGAACANTWPLLSVPVEQLSHADRVPYERHLRACARCRAVALDVWLDGDVVPLAFQSRSAARARPLPVATARSPRRAWRTQTWLTAAAALIAAVSVVVAGVRWLGSDAVDRAHPLIEPAVTPPDPAPTPLAVVIAYPGTERWIGNDTYYEPSGPPDPSRPVDAVRVMGRVYTRGGHDELVSALDDLVHALPAASRVGVLAFDSVNVNVMNALAPASSLDASRTVGPQQRYRGLVGWARLEPVLDRAAILLGGVPETRRVFVLITDSCNTSDGTRARPSTTVLAAARKRLAAAGIEVRTIFLDLSMLMDAENDCPRLLHPLDPHLLKPGHPLELSAALRSALGV